MQDEVEHVVGRARGEGAGDVAGDFEDQGDGEGDEVPCSVAEELVGVEEEGDGEENGGGDGEGRGGCVAVDYYGRAGVVSYLFCTG